MTERRQPLAFKGLPAPASKRLYGCWATLSPSGSYLRAGRVQLANTTLSEDGIHGSLGNELHEQDRLISEHPALTSCVCVCLCVLYVTPLPPASSDTSAFTSFTRHSRTPRLQPASSRPPGLLPARTSSRLPHL